jgi:hypothetical protein
MGLDLVIVGGDQLGESPCQEFVLGNGETFHARILGRFPSAGKPKKERKMLVVMRGEWIQPAPAPIR